MEPRINIPIKAKPGEFKIQASLAKKQSKSQHELTVYFLFTLKSIETETIYILDSSDEERQAKFDSLRQNERLKQLTCLFNSDSNVKQVQQVKSNKIAIPTKASISSLPPNLRGRSSKSNVGSSQSNSEGGSTVIEENQIDDSLKVKLEGKFINCYLFKANVAD